MTGPQPIRPRLWTPERFSTPSPLGLGEREQRKRTRDEHEELNSRPASRMRYATPASGATSRTGRDAPISGQELVQALRRLQPERDEDDSFDEDDVEEMVSEM